METLTAARNAMATRFEMVLHGEDLVALRAAADESFQEIERLHAQLSLYSPSSEISYINARAARQEVRVEPRLFALLQLAQRISLETGGAFDITIGPLLRCWGFMGGTGHYPSAERIEEARAVVGMNHLILDEKRRTVRFDRDGLIIDLGSIGKGYALEVAAEILVEAGVQSALLHGGTSTVCTIGRPADAESWKIAIEAPNESGAGVEGPAVVSEARPLAVVELIDQALSVSGVHGKCFQAGGKTYGHIIDPRTGAPAEGAVLAAVILDSATESDAFSTGLLLHGLSGQSRITALRPRMQTLVAERDENGGLTLGGQGIKPLTG